MIQGATVPGKWLRSNHMRYISRFTGSVLSAPVILGPSVHYSVLDNHLELSPCPRKGKVWYAMNDSKSYCTRQMAASQSRTVYAKTLSTQEMLNLSVHCPILQHHLESIPCPTKYMICHERFKTLHNNLWSVDQGLVWYAPTQSHLYALV